MRITSIKFCLITTTPGVLISGMGPRYVFSIRGPPFAAQLTNVAPTTARTACYLGPRVAGAAIHEIAIDTAAAAVDATISALRAHRTVCAVAIALSEKRSTAVSSLPISSALSDPSSGVNAYSAPAVPAPAIQTFKGLLYIGPREGPLGPIVTGISAGRCLCNHNAERILLQPRTHPGHPVHSGLYAFTNAGDYLSPRPAITCHGSIFALS